MALDQQLIIMGAVSLLGLILVSRVGQEKILALISGIVALYVIVYFLNKPVYSIPPETDSMRQMKIILAHVFSAAPLALAVYLFLKMFRVLK